MKLDWGKSILIFFICFVALGFFFIAFSFKQNNDLVTDDYYEQGANYTEQIAINKRSTLMIDSLYFHLDESNIGLILSEYIVKNTDSLSLHFYYSADKKKDYKLVLSELTDSTNIRISNLSHGRYIAKINWFMRNEAYYLEKEIFIE